MKNLAIKAISAVVVMCIFFGQDINTMRTVPGATSVLLPRMIGTIVAVVGTGLLLRFLYRVTMKGLRLLFKAITKVSVAGASKVRVAFSRTAPADAPVEDLKVVSADDMPPMVPVSAVPAATVEDMPFTEDMVLTEDMMLTDETIELAPVG